MRPSPSQSSSETARQAARREKSLNKIPAMQRVAMALEQASSSPLSAKSEVEVPGIKKSIEVVGDSDAGVGFAIGALPPLLPLTNGAFQNAVEDTESDIVSQFTRPQLQTPPLKHALTRAKYSIPILWPLPRRIHATRPLPHRQMRQLQGQKMKMEALARMFSPISTLSLTPIGRSCVSTFVRRPRKMSISSSTPAKQPK